LKTGTVIILYHPDVKRVEQNLRVLSRLNWTIVLVDNSPEPHDFNAVPHHQYLHLADNPGIATAQNKGLEQLQNNHVELALLLDQDSLLDESWLIKMPKQFTKAQQQLGRVAALGPQIICEFDGKPVRPKVQKAAKICDEFEVVKQIIASGMLIDMGLLQDIGLMDESLFIDGVDHEWCWRANAKGYCIVRDTTLLMTHRQGDARKRILGIQFKVGAPVRLYYQARNIIALSYRSYVPLYWKVRNLGALPVRWWVNRWHLPEGAKRGQYLTKGLLDGLKKYSGKISADH
jgi:rhamnosyltransferase